MEAFDIVESFNSVIRRLGCKESVRLVLQKTVTPHDTIKAFKTYAYILWYVNGTERHKVLTVERTDRVTTESMTGNMVKYMDGRLTEGLFKLLYGGDMTLKDIMNGTFTGYDGVRCVDKDQQVSDSGDKGTD